MNQCRSVPVSFTHSLGDVSGRGEDDDTPAFSYKE